MAKRFVLIAVSIALALSGCSQPTAPAAKKDPEKVEPVTGQSAIWKMYQIARTWAPDAQVLRMNSINLPEVPPVRGKAPAWQATFVSAGKGKLRAWTFSVVESEGNLHKGPFAGPEESWSGARGPQAPFDIRSVQVDTDAAYETARKKADAYEAKNPGKPITLLLEKVSKHNDPAWRVLWGESPATSNFSVYVDAVTGQYLETLR